MNIRRIIREEVEKVMNPPSEVIDIDTDYGNIFGVVHHDRKFLDNWMSKERVNADIDISDEELLPIGILKNINVNEEHRGHGHGVELFERFLTECSHCSYIILIADTSEENKFDIIDWYKSYGFEVIGDAGGMPVMIMEQEGELEEIDLSIGHVPGFKPGIVRKFPKEKEGGHSLNLSVDDGPHQFPYANDL